MLTYKIGVMFEFCFSCTLKPFFFHTFVTIELIVSETVGYKVSHFHICIYIKNV